MTVHHRTHAGRTKTRTEETKDGRSRAGDSERSEEPQRDAREKQVITGDKGPNTHWVHGENIEIAVNM